MPDTIAITGATGFVGAAVARRLTAAGHRLQALFRPASGHRQPSDLSVRWIAGDLNHADSLQQLVSDADAIVHCAGAVRGATREDFNRVNADGLEHLLRATLDQPRIPRFLLISSLSAREPAISHYAASKRQGETLLARKSAQLPWTIYRPCAVYGPGDQEMLPIFKWMARGIAPVLGSGNSRFSLIFVEDLANAVADWLEHDGCRSRTYELHDGHPGGYSWHDIIDTIQELRRKAVLRLKIPFWVVKLLAAVNLLAARFFGYAPMLTPGKVGELSHPDWVGDNSRLNQDTGWSPRIMLAEGLKLTLGWDSA
jgi:nucleoside-diphosphate-sugar epimerase